MKKTLCAWLSAALLLVCLAGCQAAPPSASAPPPSPSDSPSPPPSDLPSPSPSDLPGVPPESTGAQEFPPESEAEYPDVDDLQFARLADLEFWFSSGVGAWGTVVKIEADGSFTGRFYDSNMGEIGTDYPNGTRYECLFSGKFSAPQKTGEYEYAMKCEALEIQGAPGEETIVDGVKIITAGPYGFDDAEEFMLYLPGKRAVELPEDFLWWVCAPRAIDPETIDSIDFYGLYNVAGKQGFSA